MAIGFLSMPILGKVHMCVYQGRERAETKPTIFNCLSGVVINAFSTSNFVIIG